jgi:hypothetical protein
VSKVEKVSMLGIGILLIAIAYTAFDTGNEDVLLDNNTSLSKPTVLKQDNKKSNKKALTTERSPQQNILSPIMQNKRDKAGIQIQQHTQTSLVQEAIEDDIGGIYDDYAESPESMQFQSNEQESIGFADPDAIAPENSVPINRTTEDDDIDPI